MALDFGDAGLFDPIPANNKSVFDRKSKKDGDDENDNIHNNGWNDEDNDFDGGKGKNLDSEPDEPDDEDLEEDWPTAPPLDILDCIKGYEMVSFDATSVPPPPFEEAVEETVDAAVTSEEGKGGAEEGGDDDGIKPKVGKYSPIDLNSIM